MPVQNRPSDLDEYETEAERFLEGGNDLMVRSVIDGITDMERAQRYIKWECQHQNRSWVRRKLERKISELGET